MGGCVGGWVGVSGWVGGVGVRGCRRCTPDAAKVGMTMKLPSIKHKVNTWCSSTEEKTKKLSNNTGMMKSINSSLTE